MKYLYPYECEKKNLSTPAELQAAIDGNRREGRRSSYGQFDTQMQGQLQQLVRKICFFCFLWKFEMRLLEFEWNLLISK